jgi:hypothetical protein|nr:MAG TPA: homing endonuclease [Caudoviricetes sp.]
MTNEEFIKNISFEGEEWRDVVGFEGLYMVSSFGRVISLGRKIVNNLGVRITDPFIKKTNNITNSGYIQIQLWKNNKCNHLYAHRLVATAFIPNPNNYPCIDHIDTIKTNNHYLNLRWCTNSMNHLNPITRKRNSLSKIGARGIIENKSKPVVRIDPQNPNCIKIYESPMFAKKSEGYNQGHISAVCLGKRNHHKGYIWVYLSDYEPHTSISKIELSYNKNITDDFLESIMQHPLLKDLLPNNTNP